MTSPVLYPNTDPRLQAIAETVEAGGRVSFEDGLYLDQNADLLFLGQLANVIRERKNGNLAFYNTNIHLNPTNVCVYRCVFCAFRSDLKAERAYTFDDAMIRERVGEARENFDEARERVIPANTFKKINKIP